MSMFRRFRAFTAVAVVALVGQLVLAGSGIACVMPAMAHEGQASGQSAEAAMAGMEMPASSPSDHAPAPSGESNDGPCHLPWAPAGCQPMAPCSPSVMVSRAVTLTTGASHAVRVVVHVAVAPASRTVPPEPPPPRA